jgi:Derlin-2/3
MQILNVLITYGQVLASALALAFITTHTKDAWDQPITFIVLKMPIQYLPYAYLLLTLILDSSQAAMVQATGLAAAHLYDLLTGLYPQFGVRGNLITTPGFVKKMLGTQGVVDRPYGSNSVPGGGEAAWGVDLSWTRFGPGRTLGGEGSSTERARVRRGLDQRVLLLLR